MKKIFRVPDDQYLIKEILDRQGAAYRDVTDIKNVTDNSILFIDPRGFADLDRQAQLYLIDNNIEVVITPEETYMLGIPEEQQGHWGVINRYFRTLPSTDHITVLIPGRVNIPGQIKNIEQFSITEFNVYNLMDLVTPDVVPTVNFGGASFIKPERPYRQELKSILDKIIDTSHVWLTDIDSYTGDEKTIDLIPPVLSQSRINLVFETNIYKNYTVISEKMVKTLAAKRPFIVFGDAQYYNNLRDLGFNTFEEEFGIDWQYEKDLTKRMEGFIDTISRIKNNDLDSLYKQLEQQVDENFCNLGSVLLKQLDFQYAWIKELTE